MRRVHIARHSLLDAERRLYGYRLTTREPGRAAKQPPEGGEEDELVTGVLQTLASASFTQVLGSRPVFLDLPRRVASEDIAGLLPFEHTVLCLVPPPFPDEDWLTALDQQRAGGLAIALRCGPRTHCPAEVRARADYLFFPVDGETLAPEAEAVLADRGRIRMVAEGIHSGEAFEQARQAGFDLFQGQFFAHPTFFTTDALASQQTALMELFRQLAGEADFDAVEATLKRHPDLGFQLLQLVSSAAFQQAKEITSIRQALVMLGKRQLQKWVALLLASESGAPEWENPLMEEAFLRGRIMELVAEQLPQDTENDSDLPASAFITGVLSVIQALLGRPLRALIQDLSLHESIAGALLRHEGLLGRLLEATAQLRQQETLPERIDLGRTTIAREELTSLEEQAALEG